MMLEKLFIAGVCIWVILIFVIPATVGIFFSDKTRDKYFHFVFMRFGVIFILIAAAYLIELTLILLISIHTPQTECDWNYL